MDPVIEYFVRRYSLVLDNDESSYHAVCRAIRGVTRASDVTVSQYREMPDEVKATEFAMAVGEAVLSLIDEAYTEAIDASDGIGALLIREIMRTSGGDLAWAIGENYLPEDSEAEEFFSEDE